MGNGTKGQTAKERCFDQITKLMELMRDGKRPAGWTADRDPFPFETNVPGIFAAGDARRGSEKRVASAVGEGSAAVRLVHSYLETV